MASATKARQEIPINRDVLIWARERVGLDYAAAAEGAGVQPERIQEWEQGAKIPTVKQARKLAQVYDRPFLEFFSAERPKVKPLELVPDFRMQKGAEAPREHYELLLLQSEAEEIRLNALDLFEMLGEQPPILPDRIYATLKDDAETVAERARSVLKISEGEQLGLKSAEKPSWVNILREKFESAGILVTKNSTLIRFGARGMCFFAAPLPLIVFSNEAPGAQAFTLAHEIGHVVLKISAISGVPGAASPSAKKVEDWCNAFAAAFLVPARALAKFVTRLGSPLDGIEDTKLNDLAKTFAVSRHAMLIRLVNLGYVRASFYWNVKRAEFLREEESYKSRGRAKYYGSRYRTSRGDLYTGLVLEAWANGMITNHNAAEFMGIKNLAHLDAIRDQFRT